MILLNCPEGTERQVLSYFLPTLYIHRRMPYHLSTRHFCIMAIAGCLSSPSESCCCSRNVEKVGFVRNTTGGANPSAIFIPEVSMQQRKPRRADHQGPQRHLYEHNRKIIFATQKICAICGKPVDFSLKFPDPMSATCDHIIPIDKGGDPSSIDNLQLAHFCCNRAKSDEIIRKVNHKEEAITNRNLPQHADWLAYRAKK